MDTYGIAAASMAMSQAQLQQAVSLSLLEKSMDLQSMALEQIIGSVAPPETQAPPPEGLLDVRV